MQNYLCVNGKKTALTTAQLQELGLAVAESGNSRIDEIAEIVRSGEARSHFKLHDIINVADYELEIIGFNHDKVYNPPESPSITVMAKQLLPERHWHDGPCERGWADSDIRKWLNEEFINELPEELTRNIAHVEKTTLVGEETIVTVDRLFLPSESELFGSAIFADGEEGARYEAFKTSKNRLRYDEDGDSRYYWTRTRALWWLCVPGSGSSATVAFVNGNGGASWTGAAGAVRVPVCFTIA